MIPFLRLLEESEGRIVLRPRQVNRVVTLVLAILAVAMFVPLQLQGDRIARSAGTYWLVFLGGAAFLYWIPVWMTGTRVFDLAANCIHARREPPIPFCQVSAVEVLGYYHTVRVPGSHGRRSTRGLAWALLLVLDPSKERIAAPLTGPVADRLSELGRGVGTDRFLVTSGASASATRRAGERIARALQVPLVEHFDDHRIRRSPGMLDLPLVALLHHSNYPLRELAPPPKGVVDQSTEERLLVRYEVSRLAGLVLFSFGGILLVILGVGSNTALGMATLLPLALVLLIGAYFFGRGHGANWIECDGERLGRRWSWPTPGERSISLEQLEMVHVESDPAALDSCLLVLLGDTARVGCPMRREAALWIRRRIFAFLTQRASSE